LQDRTGLKINRIEIGKIDFLRDTALISVYYYTDENQVNLTDEQVKFKDDSDDD